MIRLNEEFDTRGLAVQRQANFIASSFRDGLIPLDDLQTAAAFISGTMSGNTQTSIVWVIDGNGKTLSIEQHDAVEKDFTPSLGNLKDSTFLQSVFEAMVDYRAAVWIAPMFVPEYNQTYFLFAEPLLKNGTVEALVLVGVSLKDISKIADSLSSQDITVFMLHDELLYAHPNMPEAFSKLSEQHPFPYLSEAPDLILSSIAENNRIDFFDKYLNERYEIYSHVGASGEAKYIIIRRPIAGDFSNVSVGAYFDEYLLQSPFDQLILSLLISTILLLLAFVCSIFLARWIARPIRRVATGARLVATFDIANVRRLPKSRISEIDDLASGFNAMIVALEAFIRYVPRSLVKHIISGGAEVAAPAERKLAVLFTDISGFTRVCEQLNPKEMIDFINQHLALVCRPVETYGGTIDKYIGDSVMAFWGAPEQLEQPEHQAICAALEILKAIRSDNKRRLSNGQEPVKLRIGIHVGLLVVGDIGAPGRVNYTAIGDTVNVASRLEQLGKDVAPDADVVILTSQEIILGDRGGDNYISEFIGSRKVAGKSNFVNVYRISPIL